MRKKRRVAPSFIGLDSFMDIVTNVIGALFFVVVYAALSSLGAKGKLTLPLLSESATEPVTFECRKNTVIYPDLENFMKKLQEVIDRHKGQGSDAIMEALEKAQIKSDYYQLRNKLRVEQTAGPPGETGRELSAGSSNFRRRLAKLDPSKHHVFFIVRADSFEVFRTARSVAVEMGFKVGWEPFETNSHLSVGGGSGGDMRDRIFR